MTMPAACHRCVLVLRVVAGALLLAALLAVSGCAGGVSRIFAGATGELMVQSTGPRGAVLAGDFTTALYQFDDANHVTVILVEGPVENPTQAVTIRMLWQPRAAGTPIDPDATNATIHYLIFTGPERGHVGIYSGAGFIYPRETPGGRSLEAGVWQANLALADRSGGFQDLLGPASLRGNFKAQRDDLAAQALLHRLNTLVADKLRYPRLVAAPALSGSGPG